MMPRFGDQKLVNCTVLYSPIEILVRGPGPSPLRKIDKRYCMEPLLSRKLIIYVLSFLTVCAEKVNKYLSRVNENFSHLFFFPCEASGTH